MIDNFLNNFFLRRRHYIQLIFKWSQLPLLSLRSNAPLTIRGRKTLFICISAWVWQLMTQSSKGEHCTSSPKLIWWKPLGLFFFIYQHLHLKHISLWKTSEIIKTKQSHSYCKGVSLISNDTVGLHHQTSLWNGFPCCCNSQQPQCLQLSRLPALHVFCLLSMWQGFAPLTFTKAPWRIFLEMIFLF